MKLIASFKYAFAGIFAFFKKDVNGKTELLAAVAVIIAGLYFHISAGEWMIVILCIGAVLSTEMINTSIEKICDMVQPEYHPQIKIIKDISAGAVLITAAVSLVIAGLIFIPKINSIL